MTRLVDLLSGLCVGYYINPTFLLLGINVHWALICVCIALSIKFFKKFGMFLLKKLIKAIIKALFKAFTQALEELKIEELKS
ncbi:hypothetical protein [Lysinibacillus sphaericus]|uniref:Uncharacterized protein n=1 Tax=Lysinibacillus sphaericus TaxID=1421 RepID=A0A6G9ZZU5_LYSSH|nr:hypothetical protein [Lysinibacillus sphaericus]QIS31248.1 hypothetical protein [Lysinibacillus sphaericus]QPA61367.1 hypothetical protein INQ55_23855 [Lysinibacillus sphaericus]